jgi:hypothetical protein
MILLKGGFTRTPLPRGGIFNKLKPPPGGGGLGPGQEGGGGGGGGGGGWPHARRPSPRGVLGPPPPR